MSSNSSFNRATETREQKQARLEAQAKALDDALRKPKNPQRHLTPSGTLKREGQELAKQEATARRVDISQQLESIKAELEAKKERETQREKSHSIELGR